MARNLDLNIKFNAPQFAAHQVIAPRTTIFAGWGRGVGKGYWARQECYMQIAQWEHRQRPGCTEQLKGCRVLGLMPTLKQFKDVHMDSFQRELGRGGKWEFLGAKINSNLGQVSFPGGSWIRPFPATPHNSKSARGQRGDVILGDEIDDVEQEVYYSIAIPWLSEPFSLAIELLGGTPTRGRHGLWWKMLETGRAAEKLRQGLITDEDALREQFAQDIIEVFENIEEEHKPPGFPNDPRECALMVLKSFYSFHATYKNAPETVSALAVARAKRNTPKTTFEREWEANPDAGEGLVYVFDEEFHVRADVPALNTFREFHVGGDHGTVDPGCLLLSGVIGHGEDATLWILDEHYGSNIDNSQWDAWAAEWKFASFWIDPSRPDRINDMRKVGCSVGKTDNNILGGVDRVARMLHIRTAESGERYCRMYISPKCKNLIREMGLYRRHKNADGTFDDMPVDKFNHAQDSLRYLTVGRFGRGGSSRHETSGR